MNRREEAARGRADVAFALYHQMGPERSLKGLHEQLRALGVQISLVTLKRYSKRFRWRERVAELDAEAVQRQRERGLEHILTMYGRHAQLARAMQGAGGSALKKLMNSETRLGEMRAAEIARLLELGLKAERHALGESADRREMALSTWNAVTTEMVKLFSQVNVESDPEARGRLFAHGVDRIVDRHLAEVSDEREGSNAR
ncbi:MAG: hypothetical protein ABSB57_01615 [Dehalococcoidia bacterium]